MKLAYERGLHELGDGLYAYLQPDGSWGWSNAGLITAAGTSMLVDTLFDERLTRDMLDTMRPLTDVSPIGQAFNTHGNGDHWFGNALLPDGIPIVASRAALEEMRAVGPELAYGLFFQADLGPEFDAFAERTFRRFQLGSVTPRLPTESFEQTAERQVGDRRVRLLELGPAHTAGDAIAYVPDAGVVFTGDILFIEGTPIVWEGPVSNWLLACDLILELDARAIVPGHGPLTDASGVHDVQRYLTYVHDESRARFDAGMDAEAAADDIDISGFRDWGDPERIAVNVAAVYREFDPSLPEPPVPELFTRMARWSARHR